MDGGGRVGTQFTDFLGLRGSKECEDARRECGHGITLGRQLVLALHQANERGEEEEGGQAAGGGGGRHGWRLTGGGGLPKR